MTADELNNRYLLALCVYREARGETPLGKAYVAQVVLNRTIDLQKRWPRTISGVVLQPLQFSSFNANDPNVTVFPSDGDQTWIECVSAAERALQAIPALTPANHYLTEGIFNSPKRPKWAAVDKVVATEGHHVFLFL